MCVCVCVCVGGDWGSSCFAERSGCWARRWEKLQYVFIINIIIILLASSSCWTVAVPRDNLHQIQAGSMSRLCYLALLTWLLLKNNFLNVTEFGINGPFKRRIEIIPRHHVTILRSFATCHPFGTVFGVSLICVQVPRDLFWCWQSFIFVCV